MSSSHEVKIYPTEPLSDGMAFMEYDVLKSGFGDFDIERCNPRGTLKSSIAVSRLQDRKKGYTRGPTAGRPGQISIKIIFVPTSCLVITS